MFNAAHAGVLARRFAITATVAIAIVLPMAKPASAGLLDGKVAIVTGAGRGTG